MLNKQIVLLLGLLSAGVLFSSCDTGLHLSGLGFDTTAPTIVSIRDSAGNIIAADGTSTMGPNQSIQIRFSEDIDPTSVLTGSGISLSCSGTAVSGLVDVDQYRVDFVPDSPLTSGNSCTLTITGAVQDSSGNALASTATYTFTVSKSLLTSIADSSGNIIESTGSRLDVTSPLTITFTNDMDTTTFSTFFYSPSPTVTLSCNDRKIEAALGPSGVDLTEFTLTPKMNLCPLTPCVLTIKGGETGVKASSGETLVEDQVYTFTTNGASDYFGEASLSSCYTFANTTNQNNTIENQGAASITTAGDKLELAVAEGAVGGAAGLDTFLEAPSVNQLVSGNFSSNITISTVTDTSINGPQHSIGLFIRSSLDNTDDLFFCGTKGSRCSTAAASDGTILGNIEDLTCAYAEPVPGPYNPNLTMKVTRSGTTFSCWRRLNVDTSFTEIGSPVTIPSFTGDLLLSTGVFFSNEEPPAGTEIYQFDNWVFETAP